MLFAHHADWSLMQVMNDRELHIDFCSYKAAKAACEHWHYSKKIPISKLVKFGVWEGGIYQACNWIYTGESSPVKEYFYNNGWRHATDVYKRVPSREIKKLSCREKPGKHRYLYPLDKEIRKEIEKLRKDYPCPISSTVKRRPIQGGDRGSIPTIGLMCEVSNG